MEMMHKFSTSKEIANFILHRTSDDGGTLNWKQKN